METLTLTPRAMPVLREARYEELYQRAFPMVARFVSKLKGTFQDSKDIFQDALVIYIEQSANPVFKIDSPERYILGIAKHLWMRKFKDSVRHVGLDAFEASLTIPADFYPTIRSMKLLQFLEVTGRKCLDLLRDFYFGQHTMKDIAEIHGYSSERSATVQKFKCIEKMRQTVKDKSMLYEDFFE